MRISTLVTLMLLIGLTLTLQARTLAGTKIAKRLTAVQAEALARDAVRVMVRPMIGEAMLEVDEPSEIIGGELMVVEYFALRFDVGATVIEPKNFLFQTPQQANTVQIIIDPIT